MVLSGARDLRSKAPAGYYEELTTRSARDYGALPCVAEIEKDIPRTFPGHARRCGPGARAAEDALRRVLLAYSLRNASVGYCQSMNVLAAWLLLVLGDDEEAAFWVLCAVAENACPRYYTPSMVGCQVDMRIFGDLLAAEAPRVAAAFDACGLSLSVMTTRWFLCLFVAVLPSATTLRVWDAFFVHGTLVLFRVALAVIRALEAPFLAAGARSDALMGVLQDGPRALFDHRALFRTVKALAGVTYARIDALRAAHSADVRAEMAALHQDADLRALLRTTHLRRADLDRLERKFDALAGLEPTATGSPALGFAQFQELFCQALPAWPPDARLLARVFRVLDQDADGLLSFRELMCGLSALSSANTEDKLRLLFRIFDTDNDGLLARADVCALLAQVQRTAITATATTTGAAASVEERADRLFAHLGLAPATDRLSVAQLLDVIQLDPLVVEALSADVFDAAVSTEPDDDKSDRNDEDPGALAQRRVVNRISMMLSCPPKLAPDEFYEAVDIAPSPRASKPRPLSLRPPGAASPQEAAEADAEDVWSESTSTSTASTDAERSRPATLCEGVDDVCAALVAGPRRAVLHTPRAAQSRLRQPLLAAVDVDDDADAAPPPWRTPAPGRSARPASGTVVGSMSIAPVADELADKPGTLGRADIAARGLGPLVWRWCCWCPCCDDSDTCCL